MRLNNKWLALFLLLSVMPLSGCGFISKLRARDSLNKGVRAFTEQKYEQAAQYFETAIRLDPEFEVARMYLATTYTSQFVPGSPDQISSTSPTFTKPIPFLASSSGPGQDIARASTVFAG